MNPLLAGLLALMLSFGVRKDDVLKLLNAGVSEPTIVEFIQKNVPAEPLSVQDVTDLKNAGAGDRVIRAMLEASRTSDAVTPSHPPADSYSTTPSTSYYSSYSYVPSYSYAPYYYPYYSYPYSSFYYYGYPRYYYYPRYSYYPYRTCHPYYPYNRPVPHTGVGRYRR